MHIVLTANSTWNILNFRRSLVKAMQEDGHEITILAPPDASVNDVKALGCRFVPLKMDIKGLSPVSDLVLLATLKLKLRKLSPCAILSFTIKNNIFGALAARSLGILFIPNVTGLGTAFLSSGIVRRIAVWLYQKSFRKLPVVFFQNPDDRDLFVSLGITKMEQCRLLPGSGIDLSEFSSAPPLSSGRIRFLMISRLLRDKGVIEYFEAAQQIKEAHPNVDFQLLGPLTAENRTAISVKTLKQWEKTGAIEYLGESNDVRSEIAAADCVVLPSYREGAPRTLIEAAAMSRPLIATDVPGCRAVLEDGRTGFLCAPRDAKSLAAACEKILSLTPVERANMGLLGREKMEKEYDHVWVIDAYRKALRQFGEFGRDMDPAVSSTKYSPTDAS